MPQIIFKGTSQEKVQKISKTIKHELEKVSGIAADWFTVEHLEISFFDGGTQVEGYPIVQINWFDRGQEVQDSIAEVVDEHLRSQGYTHVEIFFVALEHSKYYENGTHY